MSAFGLARRPRHRAEGGRALHRGLLRALPAGARVHRRDASRSARARGPGRDALRPRAPAARASGRTHACASAERMAINTPHPGHGGRPAQDGDGRASSGRCGRAKPAAQLLLTVHDELVLEAPDARGRDRRGAGEGGDGGRRGLTRRSWSRWAGGATGTRRRMVSPVRQCVLTVSLLVRSLRLALWCCEILRCFTPVNVYPNNALAKAGLNLKFATHSRDRLP